MTTATQPCARSECDKKATYEKPLCYEHWLEWDAGDLEECNRCRQFYNSSGGEMFVYWEMEWFEEFPPYCDHCLWMICQQQERPVPWEGPKAVDKPVLAHADIQRTIRYVYFLKLSDNTYYVGQTYDLKIRLREHRDGLQRQTKNKDPKLVYFEQDLGGRRATDEREQALIMLNQSGAGQRRIRQMVEAFRAPLRLLDLEA